jgi:hypothetical protein
MLSWLESLYTDWKRRLAVVSRSAPSTGPEGRRSSPESPDAASRVRLPDGHDAAGRGSTTPAAAPPESSSPWDHVLSGEEVSKKEVQLELGIRPPEFLVCLVRHSGGRMWQADLVDTTGWSKSTVSRYLDSLESSGVIERIWIGRRKLVGVPGEILERGPTAERPPIESPADSWSPEADDPA